ncbi:MAG: HEPN domain-containing protein [Deltaproteobacteria bacterium]|nr:HEPN domain-containing protein [Deltaproteobacteria bacterium]
MDARSGTTAAKIEYWVDLAEYDMGTAKEKSSGLFESMPLVHREFLDVLQPMNVQARYPTHKEKVFASLTPERCSELLVKTEEVFAWIKQRLLT